MTDHIRSRQLLRDAYEIPEELIALLNEAEAPLHGAFRRIDDCAGYNQLRLLHIFQKNKITDFHLHGSTGYGYGDVGRDALEQVFADYFGGEAALVRNQILSGTHAIALGLYGNLRPGDELISAAGRPYDTLQKVIGLHGERDSLSDMGVAYREIPLKEGAASAGHSQGGEPCIDLPRLIGAIGEKTKAVLIQRSKGYAWRPSIGMAELSDVVAAVKAKKADVICIVDNCYCEMADTAEPGKAGADLVIGSLIKNPGGTLTPSGGYITGKRLYVEGCARRLSAPGLGMDLGASMGFNRLAFQGLYQAPYTVGEAMKGALLAAEFFCRLGYPVLPAATCASVATGTVRAAGIAGTARAAGGVGQADAVDASDAKGARDPSDAAVAKNAAIASRCRARTPDRSDIVQAIRLGTEDKLTRFCRAIQQACPLNAAFAPEPAMLPGYAHPVIMAGGGFVQGSSSELSADGPLRPPYIAYLQGGSSLAQIRLGLLLAAKALVSDGN